MRSPTFATRSSSLPGVGPAVIGAAACAAGVGAGGVLHAASSATAAMAPRILMFISVVSLVGGQQRCCAPSGRETKEQGWAAAEQRYRTKRRSHDANQRL